MMSAGSYEQLGGKSETDHEETGNEARVRTTTTLHRLAWARDRTQHSAETDDSDVDGAALGCLLGAAPASPCPLLVPGCACGRWLLYRGQRADEAAARAGRQGSG
jgi:hypothetical protein